LVTDAEVVKERQLQQLTLKLDDSSRRLLPALAVLSSSWFDVPA
jgi:hypothetical protein